MQNENNKTVLGSERVYIGLDSFGRVGKYGEIYEKNLEPRSSHTLCSVQEGRGWGAGCDYFLLWTHFPNEGGILRFKCTLSGTNNLL